MGDDAVQANDMVVNCVAYRDGQPIGPITLDAIHEALGDQGVFVWMGLYEPDDPLLRTVQAAFSLHELAVEDALHAHQRAKLETYGESLFLVLDTAQVVDDEVHFGETHIFVGRNFIITVRHGPSASYAPVRHKCELSSARLRLGPGYALYAVMDYVVDNYQPVAERLRDVFETLEAQLLESSFNRDSIAHLYRLKGQLVKLREAALPITEICSELIRFHEDIVTRELRVYYRDVEDHVTRIAKSTDMVREMLTTAIQVNLALVTVRQNEVVKRLAGWGAILAIPTVVFSMYGMNFRHMWELDWPWAYPAVIALTVSGCALLYRRLRKTGWI